MTPKQKLFVSEYLIDLNATQAAIRAGYSPRTAEQQGYQLLEKTTVSTAIKKAMAERSRRTGISSDRVLNELARIAFANAKDVMNLNDGSARQDAGLDDTAAIQSLRTKVTPTKAGKMREQEVRMFDKIRALELLMRHLGMFEDPAKIEMRQVVEAMLQAFEAEDAEQGQ